LSKEKHETYKYIKELDAFVVKGGGFIYSYRNISYAYYLWYVCYHILLAQRLGVPVIIFPNSFGPFETTFSRWFTSRLLNNCALVTARESKSKEIVDILVPKKARQFPDMAFLLKIEPKDSEWARNELANLGVNIDGSAVGITMRPWRFPDHAQPKEAYNAYIDSIAEFIRYLQTQNFQPILFVHVRGPGLHETDKLAIDDCLLKLKDNHPIVVDNEYNCIQMMALYSYLGYMIGTRFHSCIFSMVKSIPTLAIGYQGYKASGIMFDMGLDEYFVDINDISAEKLIDKFSLLKKQEREVKIKYANYLHKTEQKMGDMFNFVSSILKE
jgi:colanic acid/amylovoran biosynthesis protein